MARCLAFVNGPAEFGKEGGRKETVTPEESANPALLQPSRYARMGCWLQVAPRHDPLKRACYSPYFCVISTCVDCRCPSKKLERANKAVMPTKRHTDDRKAASSIPAPGHSTDRLPHKTCMRGRRREGKPAAARDLAHIV